jgi:hypothetical protein
MQYNSWQAWLININYSSDPALTIVSLIEVHAYQDKSPMSRTIVSRMHQQSAPVLFLQSYVGLQIIQ